MAPTDLTERVVLRESAPPSASDDSLEGIAEFDFGRAARRGYPEAVLCEGKTMDHLVAIARAVGERGADDPEALGTILFTRATAEQAEAVCRELTGAIHDPVARMVAWPGPVPEPSGGTVLVLCAGTADIPVAREAWLTAQHLGRPTELVVDVGVAGLHRILARVDQIAAASAIVVVAGMDGALASVVAGLASAPVIGVPTSVGYGAAFEGLAPLLSMLNACSPGVAVVNIDNGYGAGHMAAQIAATG
ncbi:nickel pincer cofactor biosynthesis protein LarB [Ornithinimicrobium faecis]|uniref:Nickel pincer cofactor biosynthesis protein LarB n=1 Tax=Ornithinimicrobium faecis TaxID=2934158 RepID=A0ABY4YV29_9MICO|nr:nickel pincer cofactor biosynthesis protein LarB [Ornithinimicrobium sp. HY1793]USQ80588.1 nickel pincer cofactor biosynthesis protein LarB [Ornithinimicrobium sp. HY1793]